MTTLQESCHRFGAERKRLLVELREAPSGLEWCRRHTLLADELLQSVFEAVAASHADLVSIIAVGGFGRRELAPYSDVDILVVPRDEADPSLDEMIRSLHRELHNAFGLGPGVGLSYAFFLINDAPALDPKTRTAMLDARLVCGSEKAFQDFSAAFQGAFSAGEFLLEKLREREAAHAQWNDTPLAVELNLKEGAGGLRSFQCANWIRTALGLGQLDQTPEYDSVAKSRNLLQLVSQGNVDRHTRPRQAEIAEILGMRVSDYVSRTAEAASQLFRTFEEARDLIRECDFDLTDAVAARRGRTHLRERAAISAAAYGIALGTQLGLTVGTAELASDEINGPAALGAASAGEATLRELDRCGLLEKLLPELTRCRTLMPEDAVHEFSVFEHTLRVIRNIESFPDDSFYGRLRDALPSTAALQLAALLHDAGKADPGPHSENGAALAKEVARRWELAPGIAETVEWLVREHLTMARFIGMRDVSNPATAQEFAEIVGDAERLDMLTILTCADVDAVSAHAWSPAQDAFLRELHARTAALFELERPASDDPALYRRRLLQTLRDHPVPDAEISDFLERLPAQYAISTPPEQVPLHMELVRKAEGGEVGVLWEHQRDRGLSEVTVCAPDAPGLLSRILGVLYSFDLTVHGLRANTTERRDKSIALDTVLVSFGRQPAPQATCSLASKALVEVIERKASLSELLKLHGKDPERKQENFSFEFVQGSPGILEVQAPRGRGMAFRLAKMIFAQGWNIVSARFGQWAGRGAAAFYILGNAGQPLKREEVLRAFSGESPSR